MNTEALKKQDFLPVLLGSDINVYGMARSFHEAYGYKSVAVGKGILPACTHSHIVEVLKVEPRLEEDDVFVRTLTEFAKNFSGQRLLLVPCGDNYIKMLVRNQTKLRGIYEFECISEELLMRLSIKESFYQVCEEHGFSFPKTTTCTYENHKNLELPFDFPVIIKPSNSVAYWNCRFPHKKKVFVAQNKQEYDKAIKYLTEALAVETDNVEKEKLLVRIGVVQLATKNYAEARKAALEAQALNPEDGMTYFVLAQCYGAQASGANFTSQAMYWVAYDTMEKAAQLLEEADLKETATKMMAAFRSAWPSKEECFFNEVQAGQRYVVNGIATTVRCIR